MDIAERIHYMRKEMLAAYESDKAIIGPMMCKHS
jgi:hypothetical protein